MLYGIMALFGAPVAHEDHAVRACYAALRMQRRVILYADELQPSDFDAVAAFKLIEQRRKRLGYIGHEWEAADLYRVRR